MEYEALRETVCKANLDIVKYGLVELTWGNASGVDRDAGVMIIKPSGISYDELRPDNMVVVSLSSGEVIDGSLRPSSDTPTHLVLYREFRHVGGVVHTHSNAAVSWAQAEREVPCLGTTHADHFYGAIPVTRRMREDEIAHAYEHNTGALIVERFREGNIDPGQIPGILVACHGPFAWGENPALAVENAVVLESVARMAFLTYTLNGETDQIDRALLDKHYLRKHGAESYYGQD
jgi:L-ribulose-5-phosphate 4-epimerase